MSYYNEYVLVVEDDMQIRNFICYALNSEGFRYITAGTGQGALSLLVSEPIDLMLLDLGRRMWTAWRLSGRCGNGLKCQ